MRKLCIVLAGALGLFLIVGNRVQACDSCGDAADAIQYYGADLSDARTNYDAAVSFMNSYTGPHTDPAYVDAAQASCDEADTMNYDISMIDFEVTYEKMMGCPM